VKAKLVRECVSRRYEASCQGRTICFFLLCVALICPGTCFGQRTIDPTLLREPSGNFTFTDVRGNPSRPIVVWYCRSEFIDTDTNLVFVMHGSESRTAREVCELAAPYVRAHNVLVIAPQFSEADYPGNSYVFGHMANRNGVILPQSQWGLAVIEHLFDSLRGGLRLKTVSYDIVGFSGGGQFVHRLVLFLPEARYRRAVAASPGRYAFPTSSVRFPYGLGRSPTDSAALGRIFARDFILVLGDRDTSDRTREAEAMTQGKNRLARGLRFFATATEEAGARGVPLHWQLQLVNGAGQNPVSMVRTTLELLTK